ncbi:heparinase II/III family protein [Nocardia sp. NBC_01503]|uniref:heparinase II/III family protein n=1 Tax=Nocardia sp. NBC_01503 TaxID=2975997 RepID=UPI002E7B267C|nr:alginate lyase family protein [Nocardia sp. NBC_01503]WTL31821.1 heparinase II/III family protein [Nocardia sp. NBC_01503]
MSSHLTWYLHRLRAMSGQEMLWRSGRLRQRLVAKPVTWEFSGTARFGRTRPDWVALLRDFRAGAGRPVILDRARAARIADTAPAEVAAVIAAAERVLSGQVRYFGYPPAELGPLIDWNRDPLAEIRWPSVSSERIDHRTTTGDPKWIWELNRLQHLPWLAQAWLFTGEARFAEAAFDHLDSWIEQQPPGAGIAWRGAFECGIRSISVGFALQGLRDAPGLTAERYGRYVIMLGESAHRCWVERSLFSSANNHLIGELTGLAVVAMLFPELPGAANWQRDALALLVEHADRQLLPDGAGAEQAIAYQLFTVELLALVYTLLALKYEPPQRLGAAIARSSRFLALLVGDADPQPRFGDDDGGFALRLGPEEIRTVRDHLGIADAVVPDPAAARAGTASITAAWLRDALGSAAVAAADPAGSGYAPDGGLVVLRSGRRRVIMDVGPLGYLSIAAHGHADALSVTLAEDGAELIADPGTASYYGHPDWRVAHRSTRAHPTVTVDEQDQSVVGGPFMWSAHAGVRVRAVDPVLGIVDAEHDGYHRLEAPVTHRRWLIAPPEHQLIVVVDLLSGSGVHSARVSWPLHPALTADPAGNGHLIHREGDPVLALAYGATVPFAIDQARGDENTNLGWWSERLEAREPAWLVGARCSGATPFVIVTVLGATASHGLLVSHTDEAIRARWRTGAAPYSLVIDPRRDGAALLSTPDR